MPRGEDILFRHQFNPGRGINDTPAFRRYLNIFPVSKTIHRRDYDPSVVSDWLHICNSSHHCHAKKANVSGLRLIDCSSRAVVRSSGEEEYAALSYVWGHSTTDDGPDEHGRPPRLGLTIEDAMTVTLSLGLTYLWIDRYCIPDDDKARQIGLMCNSNAGAYVPLPSSRGRRCRRGPNVRLARGQCS